MSPGQGSGQTTGQGSGPDGSVGPARRPRRSRAERDAERALRDLVGSGPSQLGVDKALRGRDVNRPSAQELAEAERSVVIVRRNWTPPTGS